MGGGEGGAGDCGREEEGGEGEVEGLVEGVGWGVEGGGGEEEEGEGGGGEDCEGRVDGGREGGGGEEEEGEGEGGGGEGAGLGVEEVLGGGWEGGAGWLIGLLFGGVGGCFCLCVVGLLGKGG